MSKQVYFYGRVSTTEQYADRQLVSARNYYSNLKDENVFIDKITGKTFDRPEYSVLKRILRNGDELIISELDRMGRTKVGVKDELNTLKAKGVRIRCLDIPTTLQDIDGQDWVFDLINNILVEVYCSLAEQELERKEYRQRAGIEEAKKRGVYKGRKAISYNKMEFLNLYPRWKSGQIKSKEVMTLLSLKPNTFYRVVAKYEHSLIKKGV